MWGGNKTGARGSGAKNYLKNLNVVCPEIADEYPIISGYDDADRLDESIIFQYHQGFAVGRKDLHALITAISDIDVVPAVQGNLARFLELSERRTFAPPYLDEIGAEVILLDAMIARVDNIDVPMGVNNEVGGIAKLFALGAKTSTT